MMMSEQAGLGAVLGSLSGQLSPSAFSSRSSSVSRMCLMSSGEASAGSGAPSELAEVSTT